MSLVFGAVIASSCDSISTGALWREAYTVKLLRFCSQAWSMADYLGAELNGTTHLDTRYPFH